MRFEVSGVLRWCGGEGAVRGPGSAGAWRKDYDAGGYLTWVWAAALGMRAGRIQDSESPIRGHPGLSRAWGGRARTHQMITFLTSDDFGAIGGFEG